MVIFTSKVRIFKNKLVLLFFIPKFAPTKMKQITIRIIPL